MKITVVTVCYNAEKYIEDTIKSVLNQTYANIEYLIIDGKSTDRTIAIVEKYKEDERVKIVSEKDTGIYNAMNKALDIATGEYVIYMNAGDRFYDEKVLETVAPNLNSDIVYGDVVRKKVYGDVLETYQGRYAVMKLLLMGRMMCHQSIFTKISIMRAYRFDEEYTICADYDFVVRAKKNKVCMQYIDTTVSVVDSMNGVSSQVTNMDKMREEDDRSLKASFPVWYFVIKLPKALVRVVKRWKEKNA